MCLFLYLRVCLSWSSYPFYSCERRKQTLPPAGAAPKQPFRGTIPQPTIRMTKRVDFTDSAQIDPLPSLLGGTREIQARPRPRIAAQPWRSPLLFSSVIKHSFALARNWRNKGKGYGGHPYMKSAKALDLFDPLPVVRIRTWLMHKIHANSLNMYTFPPPPLVQTSFMDGPLQETVRVKERDSGTWTAPMQSVKWDYPPQRGPQRPWNQRCTGIGLPFSPLRISSIQVED